MVDDGVRQVPWSERAFTEVLEDLVRASCPTAPQVAARLLHEADGDAAVVLALATALTDAQRAGRRPMPDPLPFVAALAGRLSAPTRSERVRSVLLAAALAVDDRLEVLLDVAGASADELLDEAYRPFLAVAAGRFRLTDRLLRIAVIDAASVAQQNRVHERFAEVYLGRDRGRAAWHLARGALRRRPDVVPRLLSAARRLSLRGDSERAYRVAVEAFDHADGADADLARVLAGTAALESGWAEEAIGWLAGVCPSGDIARRRAAAGPLMVAETLHRGAVPIADPAEKRPHEDDPAIWRGWARASGLAAIMSAERGATAATRAWLAELRAADQRAGADGALRDPVVAACWLLDPDESSAVEAGPTCSRRIAAALAAGVAGDPASGLALLTAAESELRTVPDPLLAGADRTPLLEAYRAVAEVLLLVWSGRLTAARRRLIQAAARLPVHLPFAGLGVRLARRLELAEHGEQRGLSRSLTAALPPGIRLDGQIDRAIQAYLAGAVDQAAAHARVWDDRGRPSTVLATPGIDEVGPAGPAVAVEPPDAAMTRMLCERIRTTSASGWSHDYVELAELARRVRSPFLRGRVEALLGTTCAIRGERAGGRRHLRMARLLFDEAGAPAWRGWVDGRLERLSERPGAADPMAICRAAWGDVLTERELQVAMLVVDGASNREVADRLALSVRTVEVHAGHVFAKLDVRGRVELILLAHRTNQHR